LHVLSLFPLYFLSFYLSSNLSLSPNGYSDIHPFVVSATGKFTLLEEKYDVSQLSSSPKQISTLKREPLSMTGLCLKINPYSTVLYTYVLLLKWASTLKSYTLIARDGGTVFMHGLLNNLSSHRSRDE